MWVRGRNALAITTVKGAPMRLNFLGKHGRDRDRSRFERNALRLESLEDRSLLATFTVLNTADAGAGSFRDALTQANATVAADTIVFAAGVQGGTINLSSALPIITRAVTIDASAGAQVTIAGPGDVPTGFRIFNINNASANIGVTMRNLHITGGNAKTSPEGGLGRLGGGIENHEVLTLVNCRFTNNFARFGGALGLNGAGTVSIQNTIFSGNSANDTDSASGGAVGRGGAIYSFSSPTVNITDSIVTGNSSNNLGGAFATSVAVTLNITDTAITNNTAAAAGSAMYNSRFGQSADTVVNLTRATVTGNVSTNGFFSFGAVNISQGGTLNVVDSMIKDNQGSFGVGAFTYGPTAGLADANSVLNVTNSTISGNTNGGISGDQFASGTQGSLVTVTNSTIRDNGFVSPGVPNADTGYGFFLRSDDTTQITGSTISNNYSPGNGGGILAINSAGITITGSTLSGNQSPNFSGGGVAAIDAVVTVTRSTLSGNSSSANTGGGIAVLDDSTVNVIQSTISGNTAGGHGGGIYAFAGSEYAAVVNISGSTITLNGADSDSGGDGSGGGIWAGAYFDPGGLAGPGDVTMTLTNTIVSGNNDGLSQAAPDLYDYGASPNGRGTPYISGSFNFIGDVADGTYSPFAEGNPSANGNLVGGSTGGALNALLGGLANNGGATLTHKPGAGSPVIDKGTTTAPSETTDQAGNMRVANGRVDIGSIEVQSGIDGDFDNNGLYNCDDINALTNAVAMGGSVATFDLNNDGVLSLLDVNAWRAEAGGINLGAGRVYLPGDANLSGAVDGSDFGLWNASKFTANKNWCNGNFNADAVTDGSDFGIWNANKFQSSDAGRGAPSGLAALEGARRGGLSRGPRAPGRGFAPLSRMVAEGIPASNQVRSTNATPSIVPTVAAHVFAQRTVDVSGRAESLSARPAISLAVPAANPQATQASPIGTFANSAASSKSARDQFFQLFADFEA